MPAGCAYKTMSRYERYRAVSIPIIGPVVRNGLSFAYLIFDGTAVTTSFPYARLEQARYARDREAGQHFDTMDGFDGAVAPRY